MTEIDLSDHAFDMLPPFPSERVYPPFSPLKLMMLSSLLTQDAGNPRGMRFDLKRVGEVSRDTLSGILRFLRIRKPGQLNCGTTGCAMGLAGMSGAFDDLGFMVIFDKVIELTWKGDYVNYIEAAMLTFGVNEQEAKYLFDPAAYLDDELPLLGAEAEMQVVSRIHEVIADNLARRLVNEPD